jgi:hypothetical protein
MEFYLAIKKNEMLPFTGEWMELKIIILSEVGQVQKEKVHMFSLMCGRYTQYKYKHYHIYIKVYIEHASKSRTDRRE